ncbi:unnamed protein product [Leptosia nina]|uniref:Uncharacterized protein n=1 Tax=Leptosia nina TaxID=320188 RepID=A0AAV1JX68_9NEOP
MFLKFLKSAGLLRPSLLSLKAQTGRVVSRSSHDYLPPTQYDIPIPKRLNIIYVLRVYWETIPLFSVTALSFTLCLLSIAYATQHKIDVVYKTRSRDNISRTMDLRNPQTLKIIIINQRYEPWPEMQDVLDKMNSAQKRALVRAESCSHA